MTDFDGTTPKIIVTSEVIYSKKKARSPTTSCSDGWSGVFALFYCWSCFSRYQRDYISDVFAQIQPKMYSIEIVVKGEIVTF